MTAHAATALEIARRGIVLLKNDGVLPIVTIDRRCRADGRLAGGALVP